MTKPVDFYQIRNWQRNLARMCNIIGFGLFAFLPMSLIVASVAPLPTIALGLFMAIFYSVFALAFIGVGLLAVGKKLEESGLRKAAREYYGT